MKFQQKTRNTVELNITPLIDVVFLLLIFFMVSTTFERESELNITLPEASEEINQPKPDAIRISIDAQSRIYVNDRELLNSKLSTIKQALYNARGILEDVPVIISADAKTDHQSVIKAMDAARQLGLVRITFATQNLEEGE